MGRYDISPDTPIVSAGRRLLGEQLAVVSEYMPLLIECADETAVHDTRKAIRRSFTLIKLLTPFFVPGSLLDYRKGLREFMRLLAPCRDIAVYRGHLADYNATAQFPLLCLSDYWERKQAAADEALRDYAGRAKVGRFLRRYEKMAESDDWGEAKWDSKTVPLLVRHAAPTLVFQKLGNVRAYGDTLPDASAEQLHQLRIQFKELRYTLQSFEPLLGESAGPIIDLSRRIQDHLGLMNDASVATDMLRNMTECRSEATVYHSVEVQAMDQLKADFLALWAEFDTAAVRDQLALAVLHL